MGHTNSTANLGLPQFIGTDKPTWLGDINSAFSDIDAYAGTNDAAVSGAVSDAASAVSQAASAVSTANAANTTAGNASTAATNAVGTANNAMSLVNQTNTKIGTLANLNTQDQTSIVNAINEVLSDTGHGLFEVWTNPDISTAFASQNVDVITDITYDSFIIEFYNTNTIGLNMCEVGKSASQQTLLLDVGSGLLIDYIRAVNTNTITGGYRISFGDCGAYSLASYGTAPSGNTDNTKNKPYRILGLVHNS